MDIFILDKNFNEIALVDGFISFIWTERYSSYGDFSLKIPIEHPRANVLSVDLYLRISDSERLMVIRTKEKVVDSEEGNVYKITGRSIEALLMERVVFPNAEGEYNKTGNIADLATALVTTRMIYGSQESSRDVVPNLVADNPDEPGPNYTLSTKPADLYSIVQDLCVEAGFGFRILYNPSRKQLRFKIYSGEDLSDRLIFSPDFDSLYNIRHYTTTESYKNVAYVYHKDRGLGTIIVYRNGHEGVSGIERRVVYVDASEIENPTDEELRRWGRDALNSDEYRWTSAIDGDVLTSSIVYETDYSLGDKVQLRDSGENQTVRVTEHIRSYDAEGFTEYPSFEEV